MKWVGGGTVIIGQIWGYRIWFGFWTHMWTVCLKSNFSCMQVTAIFGVGEQGGKSLNVDPLIPSVLVDWPAKISLDKKIV